MLDLTTLFIERFGTSTAEQSVQYYFSPGRVNLIGEHIDYNGGQVLPIAISQGIRAAVRPTTNKLIRIQSINNNGELTVDIDTEGFAKRPNNWMNYPLGVIYKLWKSQQNTCVFSKQASKCLLIATCQWAAGCRRRQH